jgi:tricorn protease
MPSGYYRYPTLYKNTVVFVSEDDLWSVPVAGGIARRLTSNLGKTSSPFLSPDGELLAYVGREEGQAEVYVMPARGGSARRLTFMGGDVCLVAGWTQDGKIIFANNAGHWYLRFTHLYTIDIQGGPPEPLGYGLARSIAFGPQGGVLLGRSADDPARWKRYRGGRVGQFWIDENGDGQFLPLLAELGNLTAPMWLGEAESKGRIYFISDHEGVGNLYSCLPSGLELHRHTDHEDFYARNASTDGRRIVYHAGADLYLFDPLDEQNRRIEIEYLSPRVQRNRKFVDASRYLEHWTLHPNGKSTALTSRGKLSTFANWEGAVIQHNHSLPNEDSQAEMEVTTGVRYRLPEWLTFGKRLIAVSDQAGEETFVILDTTSDGTPPEILPPMDIGRPITLAVSPRKNQVVFSNNRYELLFLDLESRQLRQIDRGSTAFINGFDWSPDGEWVAYSVSISPTVSVLKLWHVASGEITQLTQPVLSDVAPAFDPSGKYLYFLSYRTFNPVSDKLHFELSFPLGMKPYLITLQKDLPSPFELRPWTAEASNGKDAAGQEDKKDAEQERAKEKDDSRQETPKSEPDKPELKPVQIDLEGIQERIIAFPVSEGLYGRILGSRDGKALYSSFPMEGSLNRSAYSIETLSKGTLLAYDFTEQKEETWISGISDFKLSLDSKTIIYAAGNRLRVLKADEKPKNESSSPGRKSGWLDLGRIKVSVLPGAEWRQMYREAWRLQRDQFWSEDMSQVDWLAIHDRYLPLVDRVGSRSEFSDLMWEMQGELGTSHAYEYGGDYRPEPRYLQGYLGAEFEYDADADGWRIAHIFHGDPWDSDADSPLNQPGVNLQPEDRLLAINNQRLSRTLSPSAALINLAGEEVTLRVQPASEQADDQTPPIRNVIVKTLRSEFKLRYRHWVENNRRRVHQASDGRIGYVHIPDMIAWGFAEFHRGFLAEAYRDGLLVDVRFNRGGNVSQLILEKLARRRIGYKVSRWRQVPISYPLYAVAGPMVALANEFSGSDGDIFAHSFKLMKLGPLVGKRTWGGVVGIWPAYSLVDGTITTQPEFSNWFIDVGWNLENYGTDPDIEVEISPQDYALGLDTQLERAIQVALELLQANPPATPDFSQRPSKTAPKLPPE